MTPEGLTLIMLHMPRKLESFSSLSRMLRNDVHHLQMNSGIFGATSSGHTKPNRPMVMAARQWKHRDWQKLIKPFVIDTHQCSPSMFSVVRVD